MHAEHPSPIDPEPNPPAVLITRIGAAVHAASSLRRSHRAGFSAGDLLRGGVLVAAMLAVCTALASIGCASRPRPAVISRVDTTPAHAWPGRVLVLPVRVDGPLPRGSMLEARLEDGRPLDARLYWIGVTPPPVGPGWLAPAGSWHATLASDPVRPRGPGQSFAVITLPIDAIGQSLWIGRTRVPLVWMPDPRAVARSYAEAQRSQPQGSDITGPWDSPVVRTQAGRLVIDPRVLRPLADDPLRRWRLKLLTGRFGPPPEPFRPGLDGLVRADGPADGNAGNDENARPLLFENPVLEALARQVENRWRSGLERLHADDAALAARIRERLVRTVRVGDEDYPAWPVGPEVDQLLSDLLAPGSRRRADRARAWLDRLEPATAWVIDDHGLRPGRPGAPAAATLATVGAAALGDRPTLGWASGDRAAPHPEPTPLLPGSTARFAAEPLVQPASSAVTVHAGVWTKPLEMLAAPVVVTPPGSTLGPAVGDWSLADWLASDITAGLPSPNEHSVVLLHRAPEDGLWRLYAELFWAPAEGVATPRETLEVSFGPFGTPIAVIGASSDGDSWSDGAFSRPGEAAARVGIEPDRWIVSMPVPQGAIDDAGLVRLGFVRTDRYGRRWSWPRRMTPWQTEPGRVLFDLNRWDPLETGP